ncbi:hypothetical protein SAMN04490192_2911 [Pseudomonas lundensis]|uniref:hypothetical protein n=1 Tax=Pseudomonas lundensis TaxID=86185 RepID=UPI0008908E19|nr:hypothetical protein [Pseudomonas lundensis]SDQ72425.1 hypothetical protein SAMN04490192_2911 [Pseudomonas lundensis]
MRTLQERLKLAMAGPPKVTQAALARACGIRAPSVNDWISGKTKTIEGQNLLIAADYLKVLPMWLATGKGPMRKEGATTELDQGELLTVDDNDLAGLLDQLKAAKNKASPKSQAVISRMVGLAERGEIDDRAWTLINDLLTELSRK